MPTAVSAKPFEDARWTEKHKPPTAARSHYSQHTFFVRGAYLLLVLMLRILPPPTRRLPEACPFAEEPFDRKRKGEEGRTMTSPDNIRNRRRTTKNGKQRKHTARKKKKTRYIFIKKENENQPPQDTL